MGSFSSKSCCHQSAPVFVSHSNSGNKANEDDLGKEARIDANFLAEPMSRKRAAQNDCIFITILEPLILRNDS